MASPPDERQDAEQRMLGAVPGVPALGRGPAPGDDYSRHEYHHPAAGWGAAHSVGKVLERAGEPLEGFRALFVMNHEDGGFDTLRGGESGSGLVLHLGAAQQRGDVPLPALGARVRDEQPAGLLEHVPRGERPGAEGGDRER